jgi:hypothetical protein
MSGWCRCWGEGSAERHRETIAALEETMRARGARLFAMTAAVLLLGCTRWEPYSLNVTPTQDLPSTLRVWSAGVNTQLAEPFVRRDSLFGRAHGDTIGLPSAAIDRAARPRVDALRTAGAVVAGAAAWIGMGLAGGGWD